MAQTREIVEGLQAQGEDEGIFYTLDTTPWGGSPAAVGVAAYIWHEATKTRGTDVSATLFPSGSPTIAANIITLAKLVAVTAGVRYRIEIAWGFSGSSFEAIAYLDGEL